MGEHKSESRRFILGATFTVEPVAESFEFWQRSLLLPYTLNFAPYGQILQSLLNPTSDFWSRCDHVGIFLRIEDWLRIDSEEPSTDLVSIANLFIEACKYYSKTTNIPISIWNCPISNSIGLDSPVRPALVKAELLLEESLTDSPGVHFFSHSEIAKKFDLTAEQDAYMDRIGHLPYGTNGYIALGTLLARELSACSRPPIKAVVLDADNTLWLGNCGEVEVVGITIDATAKALQSFFKALRARGVALCLCSKNLEADVRAVFDERRDMIIDWSDISAHRINWNLKSKNISEIATQLNVSVDSIVFVDDNPAECAEVASNHPGMLCLTLPKFREEVPQFLHDVWEFDVPSSVVATQRLETYKLDSAREELKNATGNFESYIQALDVKTSLRVLSNQDLVRASELTKRTTQFNFNGRHRSPLEISIALQSNELRGFSVVVQDRFGDYGMTGLLLYKIQGQTCFVDTFLLSCRVLGKLVEDSVMSQFKVALFKQGVKSLEIRLVSTPRNMPSQQFAAANWREVVPGANGELIYRLNLGERISR